MRRRIREGAAMMRTKGEAGTGNVVEAVRHVRSVMGDIRALRHMDDDKVFSYAKHIAAPYDLVMQTKQLGRLPVVQFAAGGVATPVDAALMMQLGCTSSLWVPGSSRAATRLGHGGHQPLRPQGGALRLLREGRPAQIGLLPNCNEACVL